MRRDWGVGEGGGGVYCAVIRIWARLCHWGTDKGNRVLSNFNLAAELTCTRSGSHPEVLNGIFRSEISFRYAYYQ